ncbi:MAG: four helix bundle protein [Candidatus Buchananbacteria bacterium]|nr:four helix bundle protein [Candidatus Buchananbacteria bacterium]
MSEKYHDILQSKLDQYVDLIYLVSKKFPSDELYGATSQLRRAGLSVVLNYIEGFGRCRDKVYKNFLEIAYGSFKEAKYLLDFSFRQNYLSKDDYKKIMNLSYEIGAMLWGIIRNLK